MSGKRLAVCPSAEQTPRATLITTSAWQPLTCSLNMRACSPYFMDNTC